MFTGLINHCGEIIEIQTSTQGINLSIRTQFNNFQVGESIAVDGVCLTVIEFEDGVFSCEVSPETRNLTIANLYKKGDYVNLEKSLQLCDQLGGHFVSGHVDQTVLVKQCKQYNEFVEIIFKGIKEDYQSYLISKGSVAINGVSLTVNKVFEDGFGAMLIPHTLQRTNLSELRENQRVNIEFDMIAKLIAQQVKNYLSSSAIKETT